MTKESIDNNKELAIFAIIGIIIISFVGGIVYHDGYNTGYSEGYNKAFDIGYKKGMTDYLEIKQLEKEVSYNNSTIEKDYFEYELTLVDEYTHRILGAICTPLVHDRDFQFNSNSTKITILNQTTTNPLGKCKFKIERLDNCSFPFSAEIEVNGTTGSTSAIKICNDVKQTKMIQELENNKLLKRL